MNCGEGAGRQGGVCYGHKQLFTRYGPYSEERMRMSDSIERTFAIPWISEVGGWSAKECGGGENSAPTRLLIGHKFNVSLRANEKRSFAQSAETECAGGTGVQITDCRDEVSLRSAPLFLAYKNLGSFLHPDLFSVLLRRQNRPMFELN